MAVEKRAYLAADDLPSCDDRPVYVRDEPDEAGSSWWPSTAMPVGGSRRSSERAREAPGGSYRHADNFSHGVVAR